jgi:hypothetical protein
MESLKELFKTWRQNASFARYDRWCEDHADQLLEEQFARDNAMDSEHWCWGCKYSDCDRH